MRKVAASVIFKAIEKDICYSTSFSLWFISDAQLETGLSLRRLPSLHARVSCGSLPRRPLHPASRARRNKEKKETAHSLSIWNLSNHERLRWSHINDSIQSVHSYYQTIHSPQVFLGIFETCTLRSNFRHLSLGSQTGGVPKLPRGALVSTLSWGGGARKIFPPSPHSPFPRSVRVSKIPRKTWGLWTVYLYYVSSI